MANSRPKSSGRPGTNTLDRAGSGTDAGVFETAEWSRSALMRGNSQGKEPLGKTNWAVWWWLAPLLLGLFAVGAIFWGVNRIENAIESQAAGVLENAGISAEGLAFDASYRDVEVTGDLPTGVSATQVEDALESADSSAFNVRNATVAATAAVVASPDLAPIDVDTTSDGERITLVGTVPSQEDADEIIAAAESTGLEVDSTGLTVSGLDPSADDADGQIGNYTAVIGSLTAGSFTAANLSIGDDGPVTGTIVAADESVAEELQATAGDGVDVTAPATLGSIDTTVNFDGERIVLDGTVLTEEHSATLEGAAADVVGADNVVNNLEVSSLDEAVAGSDDRVDALAASIATFSGLTSADATMNDTDLTVNGIAVDADAQTTAIDATAAGEDVGLRPGGTITLPDGPSLFEQIDLLQAELDALQQEIRENVVFDTNSAELTPLATGTLDKVVDAMNRYPLPVVEVGGHTDDRGPGDLNLELSQARADSVSAYVGQNVDPGRLNASGFGESQPIADNTTEDGQLQNRRVEFIAKESF